MTERNATTRFSGRATAYSAHRPGYPARTFDVLFEGLGEARDLVVADIGAGTGISANLLAERVSEVIAVEPNAAMRERAHSRANVQWRDGTAENTGLPEKSVDVAAAFQAFHWFDSRQAFEEFLRISRRRIALVQYERDEDQPFSRSYAETIRPFMLDDTEALRMRTLANFADLADRDLRRTVVPAVQTLTLEGLLGRIASSSYLPHSGEASERLRAAAETLFERFAAGGTVDMAMSVYVLSMDVPQ